MRDEPDDIEAALGSQRTGLVHLCGKVGFNV